MKKDKALAIFIVLSFFLINNSCKVASEIESAPDNNPTDPLETLKTMTVTSSAFNHGETIPLKYTCDGENISPPLHWNNVPVRTQSFAVIIDDTTAAFVHLVLFNIPPNISDLPEDINSNLPAGAQFGRNSGRGQQYMGPCPGSDTNNYNFYVYALDTVLNLSSTTNKDQLEDAMEGHILAWGELVGTYK